MSKLSKRSKSRGSAQPPSLTTNVMVGHTYRYISTSGTATTITNSSMLLAAGSVGSVLNAQVSSIFESIKISKVEVWTPPAAQGSTATCSVEWIGALQSPSVEMSDTTVSVAVPAHIKSAPPAKSVAGFWINNNTGAQPVFILTAPTGSIIDITVSSMLYDNTSQATQAAVAVATAVLGQIYYMSLDPNATHRYVPVSLNTTI